MQVNIEKRLSSLKTYDPCCIMHERGRRETRVELHLSQPPWADDKALKRPRYHHDLLASFVTTPWSHSWPPPPPPPSSYPVIVLAGSKHGSAGDQRIPRKAQRSSAELV